MITNDNGLLFQEGRPLGHIWVSKEYGTFAPDGSVISREAAEVHNRLLDEMLVKGLEETCEVGQGGFLYYVGGRVTTWTGSLISNNVRVRGQIITFSLANKVFRGRLRKDADAFNFRRVR